MTSQSDDLYELKGRDLETFGFARIRDLAYDAVQELWRIRKSEGWTQVRLAENLGRDTGWLCKRLQGPGNWTFRTFGALVQGLDGEVDIKVRPAGTLLRATRNQNPYSEYVRDVRRPKSAPSAEPPPVSLGRSSRSSPSATNSVVELSI